MSPSTNSTVRELARALPRLLEHLGHGVHADDLADERRDREGQRARAGAEIEHALVPARIDEPAEVLAHGLAARLLELGELAARSPRSARAGRPCRSFPGLAAHELERLVARRDRSRRALLLDQLEQTADLRPRWQPELVAAQERPGGIGLARGLERRDAARRRRPCSRAASVAHGSVARRKRWIARGERSIGSSALSMQRAYRLSWFEMGNRWSESPKTPTRSRRASPSATRSSRSSEPPSGLEQPELGQSRIGARRELRELAEDPLTGGPGDERGVAADELLRLRARCGSRAGPRAGRPAAGGAGRRGRPCREPRGSGACSMSPRPLNGSSSSPPGERTRDRVDREVPAAQVVFDSVRERREVDGAAVAVGDAPGPVRAGEPEDGAVRRGRAYPSAATFGSRQAMSRSRTGFPSSSSRIAPPTIHASSPASTSRRGLKHRRPPVRRARGPTRSGS